MKGGVYVAELPVMVMVVLFGTNIYDVNGCPDVVVVHVVLMRLVNVRLELVVADMLLVA
jgi:hypothetical protein